jgi:hypothetical protein
MYDRFFNYEGNGVVSLQVDNEVVFILLSKNHTTYNSKILNREADEYSMSLELASATGTDRMPVHVYGSVKDGVKTIVVNNEPVDPTLGNYLYVDGKVPQKLGSQQISRWKGLCLEKLEG